MFWTGDFWSPAVRVLSEDLGISEVFSKHIPLRFLSHDSTKTITLGLYAAKPTLNNGHLCSIDLTLHSNRIEREIKLLEINLTLADTPFRCLND